MKKLIAVLILLVCAFESHAQYYAKNNLTLERIRAVGDYNGTEHDGTVELWFSTDLDWPAESGCSTGTRVFIDGSHTHLISASYMALASSISMNITIDNRLPIRGGGCEVAYLDLIK